MKRWALALLVGVGALCVSCGTSGTPRFYSLQAAADQAPISEFAGLGVAVGPLNLPRYLDDPRIATRASDSRIEYGDLHRWAGGSLEAETLRVVGDSLGQLLGTDRVVVYPLRGPFPIKYRVRLDVERFDGRRNDSVELRVRWVIVSPDAPDALAVDTTDLTEAVDSTKTRSLVAAHDRLLGALSRDIAERIAQLEAGS